MAMELPDGNGTDYGWGIASWIWNCRMVTELMIGRELLDGYGAAG